jgi:phosphoglycerate dehydrogenase-like enzyme
MPFGAGIDVYDQEPLPADHPLRVMPNTVLLPHLGYATEEGMRHTFAQVVRAIEGFAQAGTP